MAAPLPFDTQSVLAVCAHPDDESFGLGAVLASITASGTKCIVLCFTHGEASTLGAVDTDLASVRAGELAAAAVVLGIETVELLAYPDGTLCDVPVEDMYGAVEHSASLHSADCLLVFDEGGITGHSDHQRATRAAVAASETLGIPVLAWTLPAAVATTLNEEFGAGFVGREPSEIDLELEVDRVTQREAISLHASQSSDNAVLWRRLELQGNCESLRWLSKRRPSS